MIEQLTFDFYWDVRRDRWGRIPYGLTHEFWALPPHGWNW